MLATATFYLWPAAMWLIVWIASAAIRASFESQKLGDAIGVLSVLLLNTFAALALHNIIALERGITITSVLFYVVPVPIIAALVLLVPWPGDWLQSKRGRCTKCGYDLRGNTSGVCPECGAAV